MRASAGGADRRTVSPAASTIWALSSSARVRRLACLTTSSTSATAGAARRHRVRRCHRRARHPRPRAGRAARTPPPLGRRCGAGVAAPPRGPAAGWATGRARPQRRVARGAGRAGFARSPARAGASVGRAGAASAGEAGAVGRAGAASAGADGAVGGGSGQEAGPPLEAFEPLQDRRRVRGGVGQLHPRAQQLEHEAGRGRAAHLEQRGVHDLGVTGERRTAEAHGLVGHAGQLVLRRVDQPPGRGVGNGVEDDQVAEALEQVGGEPARVVPGLDDPVDRAVDSRRVARGERVDHVVEQCAVGDAEQPDRAGVGHAFRARAGQQLVEDRQRVTGRPAAGAHHERQDGRLDRDALCLADSLQVIAQHHRVGSAGTGSGGCASGWW